MHETSAERGGSAAFNDFYTEAKAAQGTHDVMAIFNNVTSIPWYDDADILPVRRVPPPFRHTTCMSAKQALCSMASSLVPVLAFDPWYTIFGFDGEKPHRWLIIRPCTI